VKTLLGIDFGGGAGKATLIDAEGKLLAEATAEYPMHYPAPGWAEQSAEDWERALIANCRKIAEQADLSTIACVAVDSATHTGLLCDGEMRPLAPAIHWTDTRSKAEAAGLKKEYGERIFFLSNHYPDPIWTLPQLIWLGKNRPELLSKARHLLFEKDYVRYLLTGKVLTDRIEAQGSMLYDATKGEWSAWLCSLAGIDPEILPELHDPWEIIGEVTPEAARKTGLKAGTPVIAGSTDTAMEIVAAGAVELGDATVKLATAGRICVITDRAYPNRDLVCYSHAVPGLWYPGTATKACAASLRWFRDSFGGDYAALDREAAAVPAGCEGLLYHPYLAGELTPYADPTLRGSFVGISGLHRKGHFARAVMEGVGYSLMDCFGALEKTGIPLPKSATLIGGGAKSPFWGQMIADMLGIPLKTCLSGDSSLGSAMLAGVASGVFCGFGEAREKCVSYKDTLTPDMEKNKAYQSFFARYKAVHDALEGYYHSL